MKDTKKNTKPKFTNETKVTASGNKVNHLHRVQPVMSKDLDRRTTLAATLAAIALVLILVYIGGVIFFHNRFLMHTNLGGIDVSMQKVDDITGSLDNQLKEYQLTIIDKNENQFKLKADQIDYAYEGSTASTQATAALDKQTAFAWPVSIFKKSDFDLNVSYDNDKVQSQLTDLLDSQAEPKNAYIQVSEDGYAVVDAVYGVERDEALKQIDKALDDQAAELTLSKDAFISPDVQKDDQKIKDACDQIDKFMEAEISYDVDGKDIKLTSKEILQLLSISDSYEVSVNDDAVAEYAYQLARQLNTFGKKREFKTVLGDTITLGGGDYGWIVSKSKEAAQIKEDLEAGKAVKREPVWEATTDLPYSEDYGNTYLEIDYTNQHMYYIVDGQSVFDSVVVTGNISKGTGSPDGFFAIKYKQSPATLVGEDYESDVTYFNVFAYNVGFHDASWRNEFGGDIYINRGSHGCINCPLNTAKYIYENVPNGTPVIAYYRNPVQLTSSNTQKANAYSYVKPETDTQQ